MLTATCPSCEEIIELSGRPKIGRKVTCPRCDEGLIVMRLKPIELEWTDAADWKDRDADRDKTKRKRRAYDWRDAWRAHYNWDELHPDFY
jgi:hypothetical protein